MTRYVIIKRILDIAGIVVLVPVIFPLFLIIWLVHTIAVEGPAFFSQSRLGKSGEVFTLYKLRTMESGRHISLWTKFLRRSHLDELPQLLNILKGDMSFIGPRPLLKEYYPYFTQKELLRFLVRPGLTGLSQVSGGNCLSWDERLALDSKYATSPNFMNDLKVLFKTFNIILIWDSTMPVSLIEERGYNNKSLSKV